VEIERKFLVKNIPDSFKEYEKIDILQAYISTKPTIRIRKCNDNFILTIKGKGTIAKEEYELEITEDEFNSLLNKKEEGTKCIKKTRFKIPLKDGLTAELDEYYGELEGLFTVEVEFAEIDAARDFVPPDWFGKEVTEDSTFSNASLSKNGIERQ
jgi:CYTH domain-containing protein